MSIANIITTDFKGITRAYIEISKRCKEAGQDLSFKDFLSQIEVPIIKVENENKDTSE